MKTLEGRVSDLADVVEEMNTSFIAFIDGIFYSPNVDLTLLKQTIKQFLALSQRASRAMDEDNGQRYSLGTTHKSSTLSEVASHSSFIISGTSDSLDSSSFPKKMSTLLAPALSTSTSYEPALFNLHRNHLWGIPAHSSTDGRSAIPYILAGRDSFASFLYFETMVMVVRALRGDISGEILGSVFRYKRRYASFDHILTVATGALNMLLHGSSQDPKRGRIALPKPQSGAPDESIMKAAIAKDLLLNGISETEYLNTWEVERYLQDNWGLLIDSRSVRAQPRALLEARQNPSTFPKLPRKPYRLVPNLIPGFSHSEPGIFQSKFLLEKIILGVVSLGEGPRWSVSYIDGAVQSFLNERNTGVEFMSEENGWNPGLAITSTMSH